MGLRVAAVVASSPAQSSEGVAPAAARPSWYKMRPAWSLRWMSEAQFFYARYAYYSCSGAFDATLLVNEPLRGNADFATAYHCPPNTEAGEQNHCEDVTLPHG
ncbi:hypothetical protein V5799_022888 [Amblyomma americanum]|uniref:Uncharacterized protein n=1 Tax=Amblyomma americanum TaxID=6943 RepID=A0AAQ4FL84_AMBAM